MKTNVILKVMHDDRCESCRVKLDSNKFPYIVINNEKIIIKSAEFPRTVKAVWGRLEIHMEIISGREELDLILSNLTCDKLSLKQLMRIG